MASPFQKYQSEQVQQIPAGYVEAMSAPGRAYQSAAESIGKAVTTIAGDMSKKADEEAKLQGSLAPYLKADTRIKSVDLHLASGDLVKDKDGNVMVAPGKENLFDPTKLTPALDFYNKIGGDGSKLTGRDLTKFATEFEAQQKYDAAQAAKAEKEVERQKTLAEINKLNAEAAEKTSNAAANAVVAGYGAGIPAGTPGAVSAPPSPSAPPNLSFYSGGTQSTAPSVFGQPSNPLGEQPKPFTFAFTADRYNAGTELTGKLNAAPVEAPAPAAPAVAPAKAPAPAVAPNLPSTTATVPETVASTEALRVEYSTQYRKDSDNEAAELSARMIELGRTGGATPERVKSLNETFKIRKDNLDKAYADRIALLDSRVKAVTTVASERRAETSTEIAIDREKAAKADDLRKVETHQMTKEEFDIKWGAKVIVPEATNTKPKPAGAAGKPGTFANFQHTMIEGAGTIPGRTGGIESEKLKEERNRVFKERKLDYPARWGIGVFHAGAKEFQYDLNYYPSASAIEPGARGEVNKTLEGYAEAQTFLQELDNVVNSTDDNAITNYLNRSLWTASTAAKKTVVTGDMMNQFGVAAFRRAIVSGGNFSDADREYVAKLITDINSAHIKKDKDLFKAQTQALANFIDQKYRSTLAANDMTFDVDTAKKFLTREGDTAGLEQLKKAEQYTKAFNIDTKNNSAPEIASVDLPSKFDELAARYEATNTAEGKKQAEVYRKKAEEARKRYEDAAEEAKANIERTKKK